MTGRGRFTPSRRDRLGAPFTLRSVCFAVSLFLFVPTVRAQSLWPDSRYWTSGSLFIENQPTAHLAGGIAGDLLARGPWIAETWRNRAWKRVLWAGSVGVLWQFFLWREDPGMRWRDGLWDVGFNMVGAGGAEFVAARLK